MRSRYGSSDVCSSDLGRVIANLLQNAVRHTPAHGTIVLRTASGGGAIQLAVCDSGAGIPPLDLQPVFEPFYRGEPSRARSSEERRVGTECVSTCRFLW